MKVLVNGEPTELDDGATVAAALGALELPAQAAASRSRSTPRSSRAASGARTSSSEGARVEVLRAIQGG